MELQFRPFDPVKDREAHRALFKLSFPETEGTPVGDDAHHAWKFGAFPDAVPSYQYVALIGDELVGYYAAIPYPYIRDGKRVRVAMVCDVMTHPGYRGQGIFTKLGKYATEALADSGLYCSTGYPIRPEVIPGHLKVGWKIVDTMPVHVRPLKSRELMPMALRSLAPVVDLALAACNGVLSVAGRRDAGITVRLDEGASFLESPDALAEIDSLAGALPSDPGFQLALSGEFVRWRTSAPSAEYVFATARREGHLCGLAVARRSRLRDIDTLAILSMDAVGNEPATLDAMHRLLARTARNSGCSALATMTSRRRSGELRLLRNGYLPSPAEFSLIVKPMDPRAVASEATCEAVNWQAMWLDSDDL